MHLFKRKSPSNRTTQHSMRSAEQLADPAFTPPAPDLDRRFSQIEYTYDPVPGPVQNQQTLNRSQSQRTTSRDRPTVNIVAPDDSQPRRGRKGLFSSSIERSASVKGKTSHSAQPVSPRVSHPQTLNESDEFPEHYSHSEDLTPVTAGSAASQEQYKQSQRGPRPSHPAHSQDSSEWSQQRPVQPQLYTQPPPPIRRSNTDPSLLDPYIRPSPTEIVPESPRYPENHRQGQHFTSQDPVLSQTDELLSPLPSHNPDAMQSSPQAPQAQGQFLLDKTPSTGSQGRSRQGSLSNNMPDPGRSTPTNTHRREGSEEIDVRALLQKHDELQAKYSKVKRYYFEKDAQVQHLQNTVAHQRMAVSRTVLDDNEYSNRFQRLDGAIKDLAFSVRKDWRSIPSWLSGMVTDNALSVGTKEMTAVGRAVISRWLVEEVFQRYFHPSLDAAFSVQLKSIEMNLRRQRPSSDEDRDNASARISYWRRTTFDGLTDSLTGPEADEHRGQLVEHLIVELAAFLGSQLKESAQPGLEASVRMIIENSINIIEKIPLEARDVCVDYFPPGISLTEQYMKVEGPLPPLSQPPPPPDPEQLDEPSADGDASTGVTENASPLHHKPTKKSSIFGGLISRKQAPNEMGRPALGPGPTEDKNEVDATPNNPRIRFAAFLAVEVRGKGPATVLVKSPVWLVE
ncbi:uncharacterized protein N7515_003137 [Penicillium bovifimosum]|uniref:Uncharacterized protein n=1 Tax=Penicillium bovifimosum TaxID=126998 RepID=A0A9W9H5F8_9EURO|nr:uncharacterized protein N7515_003137 [Penicillium bovifimosum]KAJ5138289.1 hypothetical protein N7515_003137 [Penicillium bovifimosum]